MTNLKGDAGVNDVDVEGFGVGGKRGDDQKGCDQENLFHGKDSFVPEQGVVGRKTEASSAKAFGDVAPQAPAQVRL